MSALLTVAIVISSAATVEASDAAQVKLTAVVSRVLLTDMEVLPNELRKM
jgi:hypothetical protein